MLEKGLPHRVPAEKTENSIFFSLSHSRELTYVCTLYIYCTPVRRVKRFTISLELFVESTGYKIQKTFIALHLASNIRIEYLITIIVGTIALLTINFLVSKLLKTWNVKRIFLREILNSWN